MIRSNCHTHTRYCDGKNTAEEMVIAAIDKGFESLGFSGHSPMFFENDWAMTEENLGEYTREIRSLKEKYADQIEILCGIELDSCHTGIRAEDFDFVIASVHQFICGEKVYYIDYTGEALATAVRELFDGSWNKMAQEYFKLVSDHALSGHYDIVGHFDLITKFNDNGEYFDESDETYREAAVSAVDRILTARPDMLFEVNTGAMYRCGNQRPYPAAFILEHIRSRGGEITITSDAHCCEAIAYAFEEAVAYCRRCGFDSAVILTGQGRKRIKL